MRHFLGIPESQLFPCGEMTDECRANRKLALGNYVFVAYASILYF